MDPQKKVFKLIFLAAVCVVTACYLSLVFFYTSNIPLWDDYDSALYYLAEFLKARSWQEQAISFFAQHNEHRILLNRLYSIASYRLLGEIDFRWCIYAANLALIGIPILIAASVRNTWRSLDRLIPLLLGALVILQPQYADGMIWASSSVGSFSVAFLAMLVFVILSSRSKFRHVWAFVCAYIGTFSLGNGIMIGPCAVLFCLFQRNWKAALLWALLSTLLVGLYLNGYQPPQNQQSWREVLLRWNEALDYFFTFIGATWGFSDHIRSVCAGVVLCIVFATLMFAGYWRSNPSLCCFLMFLFGSAGLNTMSRCLAGYIYALSPGRYTLISACVSAALLVGLFDLLRNSRAKIWVTGVSLCTAALFSFFSYRTYENELVKLRWTLISDMANYLVNAGNLTYPWPHWSSKVFDEAVATGIYKVPQYEFATKLPRVAEAADDRGTPPNLRAEINRILVTKKYILIDGWAYLRKRKSAHSNITLLLKSENEIIAIRPRKKSRADIAVRTKNMDREDSGFLALIPAEWLPSNEYSLGLQVESEGVSISRYLRHTLAIQ